MHDTLKSLLRGREDSGQALIEQYFFISIFLQKHCPALSAPDHVVLIFHGDLNLILQDRRILPLLFIATVKSLSTYYIHPPSYAGSVGSTSANDAPCFTSPYRTSS